MEPLHLNLSMSPRDPSSKVSPHAPQRSLADLRNAAKNCKACDLWKKATQTVFGAGASAPKVMFVGEQPGDQEDLAGKPFVGPAGKLLDNALVEAGINRKKVYVTNAVKHFKWEPRGKRRIHKKPNKAEIAACPLMARCRNRCDTPESNHLPGRYGSTGTLWPEFSGDPTSR